MITIGIQGGKGSFSEEAAYKFADNHGLKNKNSLPDFIRDRFKRC